MGVVLSKPKTRRPRSALPLLPAVFGNVHNLVLEDKKIGGARSGQPHHVFVVVLDPAAHGLTVHQLERDRPLFLAETFKKRSLFESLFRWWSPATLGGISLRTERHGKYCTRCAELPDRGVLFARACSLKADPQPELERSRRTKSISSGLKS
jgi:hypothetical protein